jgi:hypothetical protein
LNILRSILTYSKWSLKRSKKTRKWFCSLLWIIKRDHVLTTSLNPWTLGLWMKPLLVDLPSLTSFRKSYHFQLTTIVLRACSLLVDRDSYYPRRRDESTLINLYSSSHKSENENHSTTKKQTFETPNFATKRSIDSAR